MNVRLAALTDIALSCESVWFRYFPVLGRFWLTIVVPLTFHLVVTGYGRMAKRTEHEPEAHLVAVSWSG